MYKPVIIVVVGALALAVLVGTNPPGADNAVNAVETSAAVAESSNNAVVEDQSAAGNGFASTSIRRSEDGHFYADAMVNGAQVRFLVDTGATTVALTKADAQSAGLQFLESEFTQTGEGVGGAVALKPVMLQRLAVGPVEAVNVKATIRSNSRCWAKAGCRG
jgi:aspartyl protease family protein